MFYLKTHSTQFIYGSLVEGHSDSERGNPLPPHEILFSISSKGYFVTPVVEHWLKPEIELNGSTMSDRSDDPSHYDRALSPRSYISLP